MGKLKNAFISGTGYYLPEKVVTNADLSLLMDTTDEWIVERTGIKERRFIHAEMGPSDLALPAAQMALEQAGLNKNDLDFIIFATSTPDFYAPGSGVIFQEKFGVSDIGALDVRMQCAGFIYGLSIAHQYIQTGQFRNILVIGAEVQSTALDLTTRGRDTAVIFGDGAGAAIVSATDIDHGILSTHLHSDGRYVKELWLESPSSRVSPRLSKEMLDEGRQYLFMNGQEVFRHAVSKFPKVITEALDANGLSIEDLDLLIPHQANLRITQAIQKRLGLPDEKVVTNIEKYGNTTAATVPIALAEAVRGNRIKSGDIVVLATFGSGFAWASAAMKW
ncbi:MAG: ketoacyl-ACP synthase III [Bdellovibrionales bacterium]|nr:ketoacyl-ACP synthase III [Bdellovibrionales bacterium]